MEALKLCLVCNQELKGRTDKRFCDDKCRSYHHYRRTVQQKALNINPVQRINQILFRNRNILQCLYREGKSTTTKLALHRRGFDFSHYTKAKSIGAQQYCFFCYDIAYQVRDEEVKIIC